MDAARLSSEGRMSIALVSGALTQKSTVNVSGDDNARHLVQCYRRAMDKRPANHLRQWREFRKMSQDDLAEAVGTAKGVISLLENGKRPLSDKWLQKLAPVLDTRPGHILDIDPADLDNDIIDIWTRLTSADRKQAASILRTFLKTGTDDK